MVGPGRGREECTCDNEGTVAMNWSVRASGEQHSSDFLFAILLGPCFVECPEKYRGIGVINGVIGTGMSVRPRNMDRMSERASGSARVRDYVKLQALVYDILPGGRCRKAVFGV